MTTLLGLVLLMATACGGSGAEDDGPCTENYECDDFLVCDDGECRRGHATYVAESSHRVCDEVERCGNLGSDGFADTHRRCVNDKENMFRSLWLPGDCADGQINDGGLEMCLEWMENYACGEDGTTQIEAVAACDADYVCID